MKKNLTNYLILITIVFANTGCNSGHDDPNRIDTTWRLGSPRSGDVFVVGRDDANVVVWKNGVVQYLTDTHWFLSASQNLTSSVFVYGNDVYVAGTVLRDRPQLATVWKNGVAQHFNDQTNPNNAEVNSIFVSGGDVFVTGSEGRFARLWKNGVVQELEDAENSFVNSVFVYNDDVYVVGHRIFRYPSGLAYITAVFWRNGMVQHRTDGLWDRWVSANSVFVVDNDVYVAGSVGEFAVLWKNGVAQILNDGTTWAEANSVFVSGSDVYVAGHEDLRYARLWKNGIIQNLDLAGAERSVANSVFVRGNDVYVVGRTEFTDSLGQGHSTAVLWKNGIIQHLTGGLHSRLVEANSVFVVE
ncbi:MAG: hypothetical protein FWD02_00380 [Bacteroidales bacterium]|nr:hypothetical protein [Bacteroidales bacterium]